MSGTGTRTYVDNKDQDQDFMVKDQNQDLYVKKDKDFQTFTF